MTVQLLFQKAMKALKAAKMIAGGRITLTFDDDGLNSAVVEISGGHTEIDAGKAMGLIPTEPSLYQGETYVSYPVGDGDGALDCETDAVITGGIHCSRFFRYDYQLCENQSRALSC